MIKNLNEEKVLVATIFNEINQEKISNFCKICKSLTYNLKSAAFIDDVTYSELRDFPTGDERAAAGRDIAFRLARLISADWILFLDPNVEPECDVIEKLLAVKHPIVGALNPVGRDPWLPDAYNYENRKKLIRRYLKKSNVDKNNYVDFTSFKTLLIASGIFNKVDYFGFETFKKNYCRNVSIDEYYQLRLFEKMKIRPKVCSLCLPWYHHTDGHAYKLFGKTKIWKTI